MTESNHIIEEWKLIPWATDYEVSNHGRVRFVRPLAQIPHEAGYKLVCLNIGKRKHNRFIHRLVAEMFIGPIPAGYQVNHKDLQKANNHVSNLEIVTPKENVQHAIAAGRFKGRAGRAKGGKSTHMKPAESQAIKSLLNRGISVRQIARATRRAEKSVRFYK